MKKFLKVSGIALLSVAALFLAAAGYVYWLLSSKSGIRKCADYAIGNYAPCDITYADLGLTLRRTFPHFGLTLSDVTVFNAPETAPSDTLAHLDDLTLQIDVNAFLKGDTLRIEKIFADGLSAQIYIDPEGKSNLDIFSSADASDKKKDNGSGFPDTLSTAVCFDLVKLKLSGICLGLTNDSSRTYAELRNTDIDISGSLNPSVTGSVNASVNAGGISYAAVGVSTLVSGVSMSADATVKSHIIDGNVRFGIRGATASSGGQDIRTDNLAMNVTGKYDTDTRNADAAVSFSADNAGFAGKGMRASAASPDFRITAKGKVSLEEILNAAIDGTAESVLFAMNGSSPVSLSLDKFSITSNTAAEAKKLEGDAKISIGAEGVRFDMAGSSPLNFSSPQIDILMAGSKTGDTIRCTPEVNSASVSLTLGEEQLVRGWPMHLIMPVTADTAFNKITAGDGSLSLNRQEISLRAICDKASAKQMAVAADVKCDELDISTLLAMVPAEVQKRIEGIDAEGYISLNAGGSISMNDGAYEIDKANVFASIDRFNGSVNDTITTSAENLNVSIGYPYLKEGTYMADVTGHGISVNISSSTPVSADLSSIELSAVLSGILDSLAVNKSVWISAHLDNSSASIDTIDAELGSIDMDGIYSLAGGANAHDRIYMELSYDNLSAAFGNSWTAFAASSAISAKATVDTTRQNFLMRWNPELSVSMKGTEIRDVEVPIAVPDLDFDFTLGRFDIRNSSIRLGSSDVSLSGNIRDIDAFIEKRGTMEGTLNFESEYTDMDQLLALISGLGRSDIDATADTLVVNASSVAAEDTLIANPFIVPELMDIKLNTTIRKMNFNNHLFRNLGGDITIKDGTLVLQELGFSSDAARMQLTALYKSPSRDNIYAGLDFHLLDIRIDELIDLIPSVDSVLPMLKSFAGNAEFHLAAETYTDEYYMPKMPTLIGAVAIEGKNLKVMDNEVFDNIKKKLMMSKKAENVIDSLSVEMTVLRNKVDIYPFLVHMDRYSAAIGGRHNINKDLDCNYHISIIHTPLPIRLGVTISGALAEIAKRPSRHIKLGKCKYGKTFSQEYKNPTDARILEMKREISETLKSNVREQEPEMSSEGSE